MNCEQCINRKYVGTGGHVCLCSTPKIVLEKWIKTKDYYWCAGKNFTSEGFANE